MIFDSKNFPQKDIYEVNQTIFEVVNDLTEFISHSDKNGNSAVKKYLDYDVDIDDWL